MWRSIAIAARPCYTRNLVRNLLFLRNPPTQVLSKPLNSPSWVSNSLSNSSVYPTKFPHQNHRFFSQSSNFDNVYDLLQNNVDESLESILDGMNLCLDENFVLRVLRNRDIPRENLGRFFKWVSSKKEFRVTTSILDQVLTVMMRVPTRTGFQLVDVDALWEFAREIVEKENGLLHTEILNKFLHAFTLCENEKGVLEVYDKFEEFECIPNGYTYYWTIKSLCLEFGCDQIQGISISQKMLDTGMLPKHRFAVYEMILLLCEANRVKEALAVYLAAKGNVFTRDFENYFVRSLLVLVYHLSKKDETVHIAQEILGDIPANFPAEHKLIVHRSFLWVIRGLCRKKDIGRAKKLLFELIEKWPSPGVEVFDFVIGCFSRVGNLEDAREILELAQIRGLTPSISSYEDLMTGYAKVCSMEEACEVLLAAKNKNIELCPVGLHSIHALIRGFCKVGELEKGLKVFQERMKYGYVPNVNHYNMLTQSLSVCLKDLDRETARKLLEKMSMKGLYLPHVTEGLARVVEELQ